MKKNIIAIIADGEPLPVDELQKVAMKCDKIIAADGAAEICRRAGIKPDYIIGDFDSITDELRKHFNAATFLERPDQDFTDLQKCMDFALELDPEKLLIVSPFGKRTDHAIGNLLFLSEYAKKVTMEIIDPYGKMRFLPAGKHGVKGRPGQTVSLLSLGAITNLTLSGFKYPVNNKNFNAFAGVSNIYEQEKCSVQFDSGQLIIYEVSKND